MPIFVRLLRLEIGFLLRQASFWWLFLPLTAALLLSAHLGGQRTEAQRAAADRGRAEELLIERTASETAKRLAQPSAPAVDFYRDPTGAYSYMTMFLVRYAAKEPYPLAPLSIGQADIQPASLRMSFGFSTIFTDDFVNVGSPRALKLGGFDPAFVLIYLLPLALIAVTAPRMSFEQDSGIIRMIAAQPMPLRIVAAAKFGAVVVAYLVWLVIAGPAALLMAGALPVATGWGPTLAWVTASVALYGLFWIGIGALAAGLWRGGRVAVGFAFVVWALVTVLLPAAAAMIMEQGAGRVSRVAYIDTSREALDHFYEHGPDVAREWVSTHPRLSGNPDLATTTEITRLARDDYFRTTLAPYRTAFADRQAEMAVMERRISIISPALLLRRTLESAAGTDAARHAGFLQDADQFGQQVRDFFAPRIIGPLLNPIPKCAGCKAELNFNAYEQVPRFQSGVDAAKPRQVARQATLALLAFAAVLLLFLLISWTRRSRP